LFGNKIKIRSGLEEVLKKLKLGKYIKKIKDKKEKL
jgi:hypothetical protein